MISASFPYQKQRRRVLGHEMAYVKGERAILGGSRRRAVGPLLLFV
jgi:hypothetical protein